MNTTSLTSKVIETRINWSFVKHAVEKHEDSIDYHFVLRGRVEDVIRHEGGMHPFTSVRTDLFGDEIGRVALVSFKRHTKGGAKMKDHINLSPAKIMLVEQIKNGNGEVFFSTPEESRRAIDDVVQKLLDAIAEYGRLTDNGKKVLNSISRKKKGALDIGEITTMLPVRVENTI